MPQETFPVTIPFLNPNETEAFLSELSVTEGQAVQAGDILGSLETTKSSADLTAERSGYVVGLRFQEGQSVPMGATLCYLADSPIVPPSVPSAPLQDALPTGLRITQPALALARSLGLDLSILPQGPLVTEKQVRALSRPAILSAPSSAFDPTAILVYGGGGHGKSLLDLLLSLGTYRIVGVLDDGLAQVPMPERPLILGFPLLGGGEKLAELYAAGVRLAVNAVGGIGSLSTRIKVSERLGQAGFVCPALVHPSAVVERSALLSPGVQVFPHAYVGSEARIGYGCIVNTGAIVSHDCQLGAYANISPGAMLAGEVQVGEGALVGMGATVNLQVKIGPGARIGNGATVKSDVPERGIVRAGGIWPQ